MSKKKEKKLGRVVERQMNGVGKDGTFNRGEDGRFKVETVRVIESD